MNRDAVSPDSPGAFSTPRRQRSGWGTDRRCGLALAVGWSYKLWASRAQCVVATPGSAPPAFAVRDPVFDMGMPRAFSRARGGAPCLRWRGSQAERSKDVPFQTSGAGCCVCIPDTVYLQAVDPQIGFRAC